MLKGIREEDAASVDWLSSIAASAAATLPSLCILRRVGERSRETEKEKKCVVGEAEEGRGEGGTAPRPSREYTARSLPSREEESGGDTKEGGEEGKWHFLR